MVQINSFFEGTAGDKNFVNRKVQKNYQTHRNLSLKTLNNDTLSFTGTSDSSAPGIKRSSIKSRIKEATLYLSLGLSTLFGVQSNIENVRLTKEINGVRKELHDTETRVKGMDADFNSKISEQREVDAGLNNKISQQKHLLTRLQQHDTKINVDINHISRVLNQLEGNSLDKIFDVVNNVAPSTVRVELEKENSLGSGVIFFDKEGQGYILTNSHVTGDKTTNEDPDDDNYKFKVKLYSEGDAGKPVEFEATFLEVKDGKKAESKDHDLAVLVIPKGVELPDNVKGITFRDINKDPLKPGEIVVSFGNPFGFKDCISVGFISTPERDLKKYPKNKYVQVDGAINPGNSGGATVDRNGNLVGLNQLMWHGIPGDGNNVSQMIRIDSILEYLKELGIKFN